MAELLQMLLLVHMAPLTAMLLCVSQRPNLVLHRKNPLFDLLGAYEGCRRACSTQEPVGILWIALGYLLCHACKHRLRQAAAPPLHAAAASCSLAVAHAAFKSPSLKSFFTLH